MKTIQIPKDLVLNAEDFMQLLKEQGMVIGPRTMFEKNTVKGLPFQEYRNRVLRNKLISFAEIYNAKLWGEIGRKRVYSLAMEVVPESDLVKINGKYK